MHGTTCPGRRRHSRSARSIPWSVLLLAASIGLLPITPTRAAGPIARGPVCTAIGDQEHPAISGSWVVWEDPRNSTAELPEKDIYARNLSTGEERVVCNAAGDQSDPAISGNWVVWEDDRSEQTAIYARDLSTSEERLIAAGDDSGKSVAEPDVSGDWVVWTDEDWSRDSGADVLAKNLTTGETRVVCDAPLSQSEPAISGTWVVWVDTRADPFGDIYARDLDGGTERSVCTALDSQYSPDVDGSWVVWEDWRDWDSTQEDVYALDLSGGPERAVTALPGMESEPRVSGSWAIWAGEGDIVALDLVSGSRRTLCDAEGSQYRPAVSGEQVVWIDARAFESIPPQDSRNDIYTTTLGNRAPSASAKTYTTAEDSVLSIASPGLLGGSSDPEGDALAAEVVQSPAHGTVTVQTSGSFAYTPKPDYNGTDTFTYRVGDGILRSSVETVTITVTPVYDPPPSLPAGWGEITLDRVGLPRIDFVDGDSGFMLLGACMYASADGGTTWTLRSASPTDAAMYDMDFADTTHGWLVGDSGAIYATSDGGTTWAVQPSGTSARLYAVEVVDPAHAWAVGSPAVVVGTSDGGTTWTTQWTDPLGWLQCVDFVDANTGWAGGADFHTGVNTRIIKTADGGLTWQEQPNTGASKLSAIELFDPQRGWAGGYERNQMLRTASGGGTWEVLPSAPPTNTVWSLAFVSATHGFAGTSPCGSKGYCLWETLDAGQTWAPYAEGLAMVYDLSSPDASHVWAAGWGKSEMARLFALGGGTVPVPTSLALTSRSRTVSYAQASAIAGVLRSGTTGVASARVRLQQSANGLSFSNTALTATTGSTGGFSFTVRPTSKTYYRVVFTATADRLGSTSGKVCLTPRAYLSAPYAPSVTYRNRIFTSYGYLKPRHTAGSYPVLIHRYRYVSGRWRVYGSAIRARAANYSTYTRYAARISFPYAGKWRLRAYHYDTRHAPTYAYSRIVVVR